MSLHIKVCIGVQRVAEIKCVYQTMVKLNTTRFNILKYVKRTNFFSCASRIPLFLVSERPIHLLPLSVQ